MSSKSQTSKFDLFNQYFSELEESAIYENEQLVGFDREKLALKFEKVLEFIQLLNEFSIDELFREMKDVKKMPISEIVKFGSKLEDFGTLLQEFARTL